MSFIDLEELAFQNKFSSEEIYQTIAEESETEQEQRKLLQDFGLPAWSNPADKKEQQGQVDVGKKEFEETSEKLSKLLINLLENLKQEADDDSEEEDFLQEQIQLVNDRQSREEKLRSKVVRENPYHIQFGSDTATLVEVQDTIIPAVFKNIGSKKEWFVGQIDKVLGFDLVPPTSYISEGISDEEGSIQQFALGRVGEVSGTSLKKQNPAGNNPKETMKFLDFIIGNRDRHVANWLVQPDEDIAAIDHAKCFNANHRLEYYKDNVPDNIKKRMKIFLENEQLRSYVEKCFDIAFDSSKSEEYFEVFLNRIKEVVNNEEEYN